MLYSYSDANRIKTIYPHLVRYLMQEGKEAAAPRGKATKELYNVGFVLTDAHNSIVTSPLRKFNYAYAVIEMLGLFQHGSKNVEPYTYYNSVMKSYLNPETNEWDGSYATRLTIYKQLPEMYKILKADPDSRRAVIAFYNPAHDFHEGESKDICCTLSLIFRLRDGKLNMTCTMRSNDILLGLPYDLTQFTFLQSVLAKWLGVEMGEYYHFAANFHAYNTDYEKLWNIANEAGKYEDPEHFASMPDWDIADIDETYADIQRFFAWEKFLRDMEKLSVEDLSKAFANNNLETIKSKVLTDLLLNTVIPYIAKKKQKDAKIV